MSSLLCGLVGHWWKSAGTGPIYGMTCRAYWKECRWCGSHKDKTQYNVMWMR